MTIASAIEILTDYREQESALFGYDFRDALSLGIEALKRVKEDRAKYYYPSDFNLPGETEEVK